MNLSYVAIAWHRVSAIKAEKPPCALWMQRAQGGLCKLFGSPSKRVLNNCCGRRSGIMPSLEFICQSTDRLTLPVNHNMLIQGYMYRCRRESYTELHERGASATGRIFRLSTFGDANTETYSACSRSGVERFFQHRDRFPVRTSSGMGFRPTIGQHLSGEPV